VHAQGYAAALTMTAGTYTKVTVNNQGLVSAGTTLANTDIPKTLDHTWITDFDTQVRTSALNQMAVPTGVVGMNNQLVSNVATPVSPGDATNKGYVDGIAQGLDVKASCMCTTTGNITLSGLQTIDGYTTVAGDRVLVKNQTTNTANGIYVAATGAWTRTPDFSGTQAVSGSNTFIEKGTINASTSWVMTTPDPITIGTSPIVWSQFSGAGTYTASGNGIVLTGTQFSLVGVANQIVISASGIGIASGYTGQTSITTLGAITQCSIDCGTF
jgi:phage-related tail fiber protein